MKLLRLTLAGLLVTEFLGLLVCAQVTPTAQPKVHVAGRLELHQPVEREITPGDADLFTLDVHAGEFLHVMAEQKGIDVVLEILDSKGITVVSMDSPNRDFGPEPASVIANENGTYQVKVAAKPGYLVGGKYQLELLRLGLPTNQDRLRLEAEDVFRRAVADDRAGTKESREHAISEYTAANGIWQKLNEPVEEALGLHRIGLALAASGDNQKALTFYSSALSMRRTIGDQAGEATTLNNLGASYTALGEAQKGL